MIEIASLIVMQEKPRRAEQIPAMTEFVRNGGFWTLDALTHHGGRVEMIYLSKFPDGTIMIHDGHHRVMATCLAGRTYLRDDEYIIREWTYEAYLNINWLTGYFTPHDPRTEVRLPDFLEFKEHVRRLLGNEGEAAAARYIHDSKHLFCKAREIRTVAELCAAYTEPVLKIAVLVFSWDWTYIGHRIIEARQSFFPKEGDTLAWDALAIKTAKEMAPNEDHLHSAVARIEGSEDLTADELKEAVENIQKSRKDKTISHCETWEYGDSQVKTVSLGKADPCSPRLD